MSLLEDTGLSNSVRIGECYQRNDATHFVWQVVELFTPRKDQPHARVSLVSDPSDRRLISVSALRDARLFRQIEHGKRDAA
jgi:hypothetical protein